MELAFLDIQKYFASFMNPFPWCDELTTIFSSFLLPSAPPPLARSLIGTGLEKLRIKSKPIFIKGTLADNRRWHDFFCLSTQYSCSDRLGASIYCISIDWRAV